MSAEIEDALGAYVSADHTKRIKGKSRFETSRAVADEFFPGSHTTAVLVYGMTFPDGLSGGAVAAMLGAPVLLCTGNATDNSPAAMWVSEAGAYKSVTFGGIKLIPDEQVRTIMDQPDAEIVVYGA